MIRSIFVLIFFFGMIVPCGADEPKQAEVVKKNAEEISTAVLKGEYSKIVDLTYPKLVEMMGGREKMIMQTEESMKKMKEQGITFSSNRVGQPGEVFTEQGNKFVVVPTTLELKMPKGKLIAKSYLLGISSDGGQSWTFIDGAGLAQKDKAEKLLPKLPAGLKLPERSKPDFVIDK